MKSIWKFGKKFSSKREVKLNSQIKSKFIHFELNLKSRLNNPKMISPPDINLDNVLKTFQMLKEDNPHQDELDIQISNEIFMNKEQPTSETQLNKLINNELESFLNLLLNSTYIKENNKVDLNFTKEFQDLEKLDSTVSSNKLNMKEPSENLSPYEKEIKDLINVTNKPIDRKSLNNKMKKGKEYNQEDKKIFEILQEKYERNKLNISIQSNNRINLNHKLEILDNKIEQGPYLGFNVNNLNDSIKLDYEDQEFKRIRISQDATAPTLLNDLMVVVHNPGIYKIESIKSLNNTNLEFLENLPEPHEINYEKFESFISADKDKNLGEIAKKNNLKYVSSTSGIGSLLNHLFFKLTNFKTPHFYNLSEAYEKEPLKFMLFQRKPTSIFLKKHPENYYSISGDKSFEHKNYTLLMMMGKYMEKLFTTDPKEFRDKYMFNHENPEPSNGEVEKDYYTFMSFSNTLLRSQIDCIGKNKNNKEILFEIKTRAVCPIRYDLENYRDYLDYELKSLLGRHSSYEREFYDLIRGAFLKYLFQIKIGGMEGAFISYHNTKKIFGFEFIKLEDMQRRMFGNSNFSDIIFKSSIRLLECIFDRVLQDFGSESDILKIGFFANEWTSSLDVFVEIIYPNSYLDTHKYEYNEFIDYYYLSQYKPVAYKYSVNVFPIVNDILHVFSPLLFEKFDNFGCRYKINFKGKVTFEEYMKFLHEAYASMSINIENQYTGSWSGFFK